MGENTESGTINRNAREREERLAAAKAEERTGIAGAEDFEPLLPPQDASPVLFGEDKTEIQVPPRMVGYVAGEMERIMNGVGEGGRANEVIKAWDPSMGRKRVTDEVLGLPRGLGAHGPWHETLLSSGWHYHESADAQVYRKPKSRVTRPS